MSEYAIHKKMIQVVAAALGPDLLQQVAFVGGATTSLLITDDFTREQVRHTKDIDLIVNVITYVDWSQLQAILKKKGFREMPMGDHPICALQLEELRVDFMPSSDLLGFSNRWYADALKAAEPYQLTEQVAIRLVTPPYFVATKIEAFKGRGENDPLGSQDIEDILNLFNGRPSLLDEIRQAPQPLRAYIATEIAELLKHPGMAHAIEGSTQGQRELMDYLYESLEAATSLGN